MAKNKLTDLNDHLFAQLERLSDEDLKGDALNQEIERGKAVSQIASNIVSNASVQLKAIALSKEWGGIHDGPSMLGLDKQ